MKQIIPFHSYQEAIESFDNGGRFFNFLSHANDGVVTPAELGGAAGATQDPQAMILYLMMSVSHLDNRSKERVIAHLNTALFDLYEKYRPVPMSLEQFATIGKPGISTMIVGTPKKISSKSDFGGSIMVPVIVDAVTSFAIVPIVTAYDVYEVTSDEGDTLVTVAHHKEKSPLPERKLRLGGTITSLNPSEESPAPSEVFLEVQYYLEED